MPSSDIRRLNGIIEAIIHVIIIATFLIIAHYLGFKITIGFALYVISTYFISAGAFHITRSIFRLVDKNLEKQALEEINISVEEIPEKEKPSLKDKLKNVLPKKKEPITVDTLNSKKTVFNSLYFHRNT